MNARISFITWKDGYEILSGLCYVMYWFLALWYVWHENYLPAIFWVLMARDNWRNTP